MALSLSRASIKGGSVTGWNIQTAAGTGWAGISFLRNGKFNLETLSTKTSTGINRPYAVKLTASVQTIATGNLTKIIEVLDSMVGAEVESQIQLDNGQTFDSSLIAPSANESGAGFSWKFVSDKDRDDTAYIEFQVERIMSIANAETALGGTFETSLSPTNANFTAWEQTIADIVPAGINTIKAGAGAYTTHDFGIIRNGKFTAETLTVKDSYGRNCADGRIKVMFEADMLQASSTEVNQLDTIAGLDLDWQLVFASGRTFQADSALGFDYNLEVGTDREGVSFVKIKGEGIMASSAWDTAWT